MDIGTSKGVSRVVNWDVIKGVSKKLWCCVGESITR